MTDLQLASPAVLHTVLHPTDFAEGSEVALAHALRFALRAGARLEVLHAEPDNMQIPASRFPNVVATLVRWGMLPPGSVEADLAKLGMGVGLVLKSGAPAVSSIVVELENTHPDLLVMATHGREGLRRLLEPSVTEPTVRLGRTRTLVIPHGVTGFVSVQDGTYDVQRILVPIDHVPNPQAAVDAAAWAARILGLEDVSICTLHIGDADAMPRVRLPPDAGWQVHKLAGLGAVVDGILDTARSWNADLIVMATEGHVSLLDSLRGSTAERVLRRARCPMLLVPSDAHTHTH